MAPRREQDVIPSGALTTVGFRVGVVKSVVALFAGLESAELATVVEAGKVLGVAFE
jgi:hypothetical protein